MAPAVVWEKFALLAAVDGFACAGMLTKATADAPASSAAFRALRITADNTAADFAGTIKSPRSRAFNDVAVAITLMPLDLFDPFRKSIAECEGLIRENG